MLASEIRIGELAPSESEAAVALWEEAGLTRPWNDPRADIARALAGPSSTVLAGRIEGALIATVMVGWDGHRGWIYYLTVATERRREGHGAQMLHAAEAWLVERGAPKLMLLVRKENDAVVAFYQSQGYRLGDIVMLQRELS